LGDELTDLAHQHRQILGPYDKQSHQTDDKDFEPADSRAKTTHDSASFREGDQRFNSSFSASVRGSELTPSFGPLESVSSFRPSLKARMPLAASPMMPDSLPRPPNRRATTT